MSSELPPALISRDPRAWWALFGPGAVIASLTIGSGELIFSTRGGAIFGYPLLSVFLLVCLLKWALMYSAARHMVLSGAHPFERWSRLPGPPAWLPVTFLVLAMITFPVWVAFHSGVIGGLVSHLAHGPSTLWGMAVLLFTLLLVWLGGYERLEKVQLVIIGLMLAVVAVSLILLRPDWLAMIAGVFQPPSLDYPEWVKPSLVGRPVWVELATYAGVIGGSGYDYLAYLSYLRDKGWGQAGLHLAGEGELAIMARDAAHPNRLWLRAPLVDGVASFVVVFLFTAVFVACGREVLGPRQQLPQGNDLLTLQRQIVAIGATNWFVPLYYLGAFLAMFGTLYGTIETAPVIFREAMRALGEPIARCPRRERRLAVGWAGLLGLGCLGAMAVAQLGAGKTLNLIEWLTPAALFTNVLACGIVAALTIWADAIFLPAALRARPLLRGLCAVSGLAFLLLGAKAYFDKFNAWGLAVMAAPLALGLAVSWIRRAKP